MKNINKGIDMEVREIVFSNDEEGKSFCDIFVYEPENIGEQSLGNLYIIGEIVNVSENSSYLVNLLASIIKKEFYSNIKRTTIESLEAGLHKANSTLSDIAEQGNIDWVGNLNMVCAVYSGDELHFSQTGNCKTLLIRNGQITDIGKNITRKEKTHPFRTFTNIASGELEIEDIALFITPGFFNIFSLEKLRKLSSSLELDEFAKKLQNSIEQEKNLDTAGSLIMKIKNSEQKKDSLSHIEIELATEKIYEKETEKDNQKVSLENIIEEYEKEEEKDSKIERKMEIPKETEKEKEEIDIDIINKEQDKREGISLDDLIEKNDYLEKEIEKEKPERNVLAKLLKVLNSIFSFLKIKVVTPIVNYIKEISKLVSLHRSLPAERLQQDGDSDISKEVPTETGMKLSQCAKLIPIKNKHLLIIFVIIITVLVWNVISTNYQKEKSDKFEKYSDILSQAENQIGKVESIVIYGDFETARNLLTDAKNSTLEVKNKYDKLDSKADILLKKIQVQFDRVDLVNRIDNPKIAVDLGQTEELKDSGEIIKIGGEYYISDLSNNSLFQVDFENSKANHIQAEIGDDIGKFKISTAMKKTGEIIFLTNLDELAVFNTSKKKFNAEDIKFSNDISNAKDIASYSSYLYLLKPDSNQIYKHTRLANGFGKEKIWIEDPGADIKNAVSFAIDGSIYILKSDGSVDKYLSGSKFKSSDDSNFSIEKLGDPISTPTEICTRSDLNYLYIIEPQKNRVVLFDKISGKLFRQYTSESFGNLKNIVVDDKEEKMFVLSGDKVFEIEIEK